MAPQSYDTDNYHSQYRLKITIITAEELILCLGMEVGRWGRWGGEKERRGREVQDERMGSVMVNLTVTFLSADEALRNPPPRPPSCFCGIFNFDCKMRSWRRRRRRRREKKKKREELEDESFQRFSPDSLQILGRSWEILQYQDENKWRRL